MARGTFGERLKRERELREVTLEEITQATRIGSRFLEALENEDWDKLPGGVFNRGFVRSIAHYLGLDEEAFLGEYDLAHAAHADQMAQKHALKIEDRIPPTPLWIPVALVLGILLLAAAIIFGGIYAWRRFIRHSAPKPTATFSIPATNFSMNTSTSPLPTSSRASLSAANPPNTTESPLDLSVSASTLTRVRLQADGTSVLDASMRPGENRHFFAKTEFVVAADDSSAVLLELNPEAMPPVGAPGTSGTIILTGKNLRQVSGGNFSPEVIDQLRHGRAPRERKIAVCTAGAHLSAVDRAEILCVLSEDPDEVISTRAQEAMLSIAPEVFVEAVTRETAVTALFSYVAKKIPRTPGIAEAMVANKHCPPECLLPLVPYFSPALVQKLLEELDRVTANPHLALTLEHSAFVTPEQKKTLEDFRSTHIDHGHLADAAAEAEPDPNRRQTLLQQIGRMTVAQRVQFAMKGSSEARRTLIRDSNKVVQRSVLQSPRLTDQEVEAFAAMPNLTDEILRQIAGNRNFRKNYVVVRNLLNNPKTPLDVTLHMLPVLTPADLKKLGMNKNVPETLRSSALKLQRTRASTQK